MPLYILWCYWGIYLNFYQRMGILPLKKRVNRDKCSFATKQRMFGVFAIDEILCYRWSPFAASRTFCHTVSLFNTKYCKIWPFWLLSSNTYHIEWKTPMHYTLRSMVAVASRIQVLCLFFFHIQIFQMEISTLFNPCSVLFLLWLRNGATNDSNMHPDEWCQWLFTLKERIVQILCSFISVNPLIAHGRPLSYLGEPTRTNSTLFFIIVQTAVDPPPFFASNISVANF